MTTKSNGRFLMSTMLALVAGCLLAMSAASMSDNGELAGRALIDALREGGHIIYFRHAATDWSFDDHVAGPGDWVHCHTSRMRQLSRKGRQVAQAIGEAMRHLAIPVDRVIASPYCRTVETAQLLAVGPVETTTDIINARVAEYFGGIAAVAETARRRLSIPPATGSNTVLVAHGNVLRAAAKLYIDEAEAAIFRPDGNGGFSLVARVLRLQWVELSAEYARP